MSKKKRQDKEFVDDLQLDAEVGIHDEDAVDEDDENEDSEQEDVFAEDESDIAMMRNLEAEDNKIALETFSFDEEVGFNTMYDWSTVAESETSRFKALKEMDVEALRGYSWKRLNNMQKWMVARACSLRGLHEMFREIVLVILKSRKPSPELCNEDIALELVWDYIETKEYDEALATLDRFEQAYPAEQAAAMRARALVFIDMGEVEKGKSLIEQIVNLQFNRNIKGFEDDKSTRDSDKSDGVIQYEIGYSLLNMKHYELAMHYFERARNLANMNDNYELTMNIDNARAMTVKAMNQETEH